MSNSSHIFLGNFQPIRLTSHSSLKMHLIIGIRHIIIVKEILDTFNITGEIIDRDTEESYMCCTFAKANSELAVVAGQSRIVKVIDPIHAKLLFQLKGHGGSINTIQNGIDGVVFTGSEDTSIRMWCLYNKKVICIFGGIAGHRDQVLSLNLSLCKKYLVSSSHDCTIKVWKVPDKCKDCQLYYFNVHSCDSNVILKSHFPIFSSSEIHRTFITCVRFFGEFIVARGTTEKFVIFKPDFETNILNSYDNSECFFIDEYVLESSKLNFKFFVDYTGNKILIASDNENATFHLCNLNFMEERGKVYKGSSNRKSIIRDITLYNNHIYILYNDNVLEKIKL